jgi:uncharacterized protein YdaU (DUF1376 family)
MARRNQPYLPLYVQDFLTDEKLNECSASATGVYIRLMCIMHKSEKYGAILLKQKYKQSDEQILNFAHMVAKQLPYDLEIVLSGLKELIVENVIKIDGDCLYQKRMINDSILSDKRAKSGKKGGEIFASNFARAKNRANTENEIENSNTIHKKVKLAKNETEFKPSGNYKSQGEELFAFRAAKRNNKPNLNGDANTGS